MDRADVKAEKRQLGDDQRTSDSAGRNHEKNNGGSPGIARHTKLQKLEDALGLSWPYGQSGSLGLSDCKRILRILRADNSTIFKQGYNTLF